MQFVQQFFCFKRHRSNVASSSENMHTTRVQKILLDLSKNVCHIPADIQDQRIAFALLAISSYKDPAFHPKMRVADVIELNMHRSEVLQTTRMLSPIVESKVRTFSWMIRHVSNTRSAIRNWIYKTCFETHINKEASSFYCVHEIMKDAFYLC